MRKLCDFPSEASARIFGDAIYARGIENSIEPDDDGYAVWVHEDEQLGTARDFLRSFEADSSAFSGDAARAGALRAEEAARDRKRASRIITRERLGYDAAAVSVVTPLFIVLVMLCVAGTFLAGHFGLMPSDRGESGSKMEEMRETWRGRLFISSSQSMSEAELEVLWRKHLTDPGVMSGSQKAAEEGFVKMIDDLKGHYRRNPLPEVRRGEVWRLITPIFIHFGLLHLIFNLMWLFNFGSFIERFFSTRYLIFFILAAGVLSCIPQYFWSGPRFGGFSGVNYALFGFLWVRGKTDRTVAWRLPPAIVTQLMIWLVICMTGAMGSVANTAHVAGLVVGAAWGGLSGWWRSRR